MNAPDLPLRMERRMWGGLLLASLIARLAGLGIRALAHDESLHAVYSWYLARSFHYEHDPMMHGPLLFHLNALVFTLFGASDFTSRLIPALAGTGCVAMLWLYRRWLGKRGAFIAAALVSLDPGHLYYSRYIRNDIYISLFTLLMVYAILRYPEDRKPKHLLLLSFGLAISFATKEVAFIHGFTLGLITLLLAAIHSIPSGKSAFRNPQSTISQVDLSALLLTLALPFATPLLHKLLGWDPLDTRSMQGQLRTFGLAAGMFGLSATLAVAWFGTGERLKLWGRCFGLFWGIQLLLFSTLFTNLAQGLSSGIAGSLGYWLPQHDVQRGSPDRLFYLSLLLLYTPLLLVTLGPGLKRLAFPPAAVFGLWFLGHLIIYSWAGERMPWLLLHISLPLCLLAGPALAGAFTERRPLRWVYLPLLIHFTVNSLRLNGPLAESTDEPLVYAHSGPQLKTALRIMDSALKRDPGSVIFSHPDFAWPMTWYFRERPVRYTEDFSFIFPEASVLLLPLHDYSFQDSEHWTDRGSFAMTDWPRQHWHAITRANLHALLTRSEIQTLFLNYYFLRRLPERGPADFPQPHSFRLLTRPPLHEAASQPFRTSENGPPPVPNFGKQNSIAQALHPEPTELHRR